jgi:hypothetical protein
VKTGGAWHSGKRGEMNLKILLENVMERGHLEDCLDGKMILKWVLNKMGRVSVDSAEGCGEAGCYSFCEQGIKHLSSVKNMGNCSSSQLSDHCCLKKDSAVQGWINTYYFTIL